MGPGKCKVIIILRQRTVRWLTGETKLFNVLREKKVNILIYSPKGDGRDFLRLEEKGNQVVINDFRFSLIYCAQPYLVYREENLNVN